MSEEVTKIEIGKTYDVSAYWKKSLVEIETFMKDGKAVNVETLWRNGTFIVTIENEDEQEYLQNALGKDGAEWDYEDYSSVELNDTFDGCAEDWYFWGDWKEAEGEELNEKYHEALEDDEMDLFGFYDFLVEHNDFSSEGCNWVIHNGVSVVLSEQQDNI